MSYSSTILATSGLISYWRLNDTSAPIVDSQDSNNGSIVGGLTLNQAGPSGTEASIFFSSADDGTTSQYVDVPSNSNINIPGNFSIELWIKRSGTPSFNTYLIYKDNDFGYHFAWTSSNKLNFWTGATNCLSNTLSIGDNNWHQVIVTFGSGTLKYYIDGTLFQTFTSITVTGTADTLDFQIGSNGFNGFDGYISNVAFYNAELSSGSVSAHYSAMSGGGGSVINSTVSQTLTLTQTVVRHIRRSKTLSQSLTFTQLAFLAHSPPVNQNITFTQTLVRHVKFHKFPSQFLTFTQIVSAKKKYHKTVSQSLSLSQSITSKKIKQRRLSQRLTFTQSLIVHKRKNIHISQNISFRDGARTNKRVNINIAQTLLFTGGGGHGSVFTYNPTITTSTITKTIDGKTFIYSDVIAVKIVKYITLTGNSVIILPSPLFGDSRTNIATMSPLRMVDGTVFTYLKTTKRQRLIYKFELKRQKASELQKFLDDNDLVWLTMDNFKGERWFVRVTNNPIIFTATGRGYVCPNNKEVHQVEIIFEGFRISAGASSC